MFNCKEIYRVTIEDVVFKLNKAHSPYIDLITKTLDEKELTINVSYYFTTKAKFFSYSELNDILDSFGIELNEDNIFDSLNQLIGKNVYLLRVPEYENKYQVFKDYNQRFISLFLCSATYMFSTIKSYNAAVYLSYPDYK